MQLAKVKPEKFIHFPLLSEAEYEVALADIEKYFINQPLPNTHEERQYLALFSAIEAYEDKYCNLK